VFSSIQIPACALLTEIPACALLTEIPACALLTEIPACAGMTRSEPHEGEKERRGCNEIPIKQAGQLPRRSFSLYIASAVIPSQEGICFKLLLKGDSITYLFIVI